MRNWYAASIIMYTEFKDGNQNYFPIWENVVLIFASSDQEAYSKAVLRGKSEEGDCRGTYTWEGRPAKWTFADVRKVIKCGEPDRQPSDGTEITYSEMTVKTLEDLHKLASGDPIDVSYEM